MPTVNPRINVTLPPSLEALVSRMAVHQRVSKSQVLRELLEAAEPALQRAVALMDAAAMASSGVRKQLAAGLDRVQTQAEDALSQTLAGMDAAQSDLVTMAERVRERRPTQRASRAPVGAPAPSNPPSSNRGVKSTAKGGELGSRAPRKGVKS